MKIIRYAAILGAMFATATFAKADAYSDLPMNPEIINRGATPEIDLNVEAVGHGRRWGRGYGYGRGYGRGYGYGGPPPNYYNPYAYGRADVYRDPYYYNPYPPEFRGRYMVPGGGCSYYGPSVPHPRYVDPCPGYGPPPGYYGGREFRGGFRGFGFSLNIR